MFTVKPPNTVTLGGKQNGTVLQGQGIRGFTVHRKKRGKEWPHGIWGDTVFWVDTVFGGTRYSGGRY